MKKKKEMEREIEREREREEERRKKWKKGEIFVRTQSLSYVEQKATTVKNWALGRKLNTNLKIVVFRCKLQDVNDRAV